ncbi:MAG: iron-siderophore ABC transporter substrate-binding protein [Patulibacter sp.]|nr:iron-siderophore ABC transporter substrate-binding protein [Patulibacter sp.]
MSTISSDITPALEARHRRGWSAALLVLLLVAAAFVLAACGDDDSESASDAPASTATAGSFPVTVEGAFGSATIEQAPQRVVTIGWSDADVALALGVKPVGTFDIGPDFPKGVGPWAAERFGDETPELLKLTDGLPFEKIAALRPDLIVAVQSGVTAEEHAKLEQLAPTVTYREGRGAYLTPWKEQTELIGAALGQPDQARELIEQTDATIAKAREDHPDLQGKSFSFVAASDPSQLSVYAPDDLRVQFMESIGMRLSEGQQKLVAGEEFFVSLSFERIDELKADALVAWFNTPAARKTFTDQPAFRGFETVERGGFAPLDIVQAQAQGAPTPLSIPWAIENVTPVIEKAVAGDGPRS